MDSTETKVYIVTRQGEYGEYHEIVSTWSSYEDAEAAAEEAKSGTDIVSIEHQIVRSRA